MGQLGVGDLANLALPDLDRHLKTAGHIAEGDERSATKGGISD